MLISHVGGSHALWFCLTVVLSLLPALVHGQATKTASISSATAALNSLRPASARAFCTSYIGGQPVTVVSARTTGVFTSNVVTTSTVTLATETPRRSVTVSGTTTETTTTTWTRATQYPETEDVYTTATVTLIDPAFTAEEAGQTTSAPSITRTQTQIVYSTAPVNNQRKRQAAASPSVPPALSKFAGTILSSACSTYLGTSTSSVIFSFWTSTTVVPTSTRVVTSTAPPVTETRWTTTTRRALVTTTAQATATRVNVDSATAQEYSGTTTTTNPAVTTTAFYDGTTTVTTSTTSTIYTPAPCLPTIFPSGGTGNTQSMWVGAGVDDSAFNIDLPFEMQMFGTRARQLYVTSNSIVGLVPGSWTGDYRNGPLPAGSFNAAIFAFWDDLAISGQPWQGIWWQFTSTGIVIEFIQTHLSARGQFYHYSINYDTRRPGVFTIRYYSMDQGFADATIGAQAGGGGTVIPYTKGPDSTNRRIIEFDTLANSVIDVEFNGRCTPNYGWL